MTQTWKINKEKLLEIKEEIKKQKQKIKIIAITKGKEARTIKL